MTGTVENPVMELSETDIQKGYDAAAPICRIDKYAAYSDWLGWVGTLDDPPRNPVGHWISFCRKRAEQSR